jgi:uncharacterized RDD family membrane protein YckC
MKCPKCEYLGFDTGERCRNCGYEFSLSLAEAAVPDFDLRTADDMAPATDAWLNALDTLHTHVNAAAPIEPPLPLFTPSVHGDDEPMIKLPAAPRPPLAVRRTPETPRLRNIARAVRKTPNPSFEFAEEPPPQSATEPGERARVMSATQPRVLTTSGAGRRLAAAIVDNAILLAIDLSVVYFTLKIAALSLADWPQLPVLPLLVFLLFLKFAYFAAFTAVGGQTIGKMGSGIRVITEDGSLIDASRAIRRSLAGAISLATLGAAFAPALLGSDGRALHDRVARTRVVTL